MEEREIIIESLNELSISIIERFYKMLVYEKGINLTTGEKINTISDILTRNVFCGSETDKNVKLNKVSNKIKNLLVKNYIFIEKQNKKFEKELLKKKKNYTLKQQKYFRNYKKKIIEFIENSENYVFKFSEKQ